MSRLVRSLGARSCAVGRGERGIRAVIAVFLGAFALNNLDTPVFAILAGGSAAIVAIGAITGWCPTSLLGRTPAESEPNTLGYPEARQQLQH
ncbi:YgaP family membrane protein [Agromyces sp. ZXT2-6]|uniref:YgaP family membrane protein n=1 Tax=Agromyces sp. ZXT2-6 TaxID=3461153 RepID=UPI0040550C20